MKSPKTVLAIMALVLGAATSQTWAAPATEPGESRNPACAALQGLTLGPANIEVATFQPANEPVEGTLIPAFMAPPGQGEPVSGVPEFCRVQGRISAEPGSDIRFEVWMPASGWDGRFFGAGNGGFAGTLSYEELAAAVRAGHSAMSTDTGHQGQATDGSWAKGHPQRVRDFGWRAIHLSTVAAKAVVKRYYGRPHDHAYFAACSNGGRQALMEASRFPGDYDGIIAGAPASAWTELMMAMIWNVQAQQAPGAQLRFEQAKTLQQVVLGQCDALDGIQDGLVQNPLQCKPDFADLTCAEGAAGDCFSFEQVAALEKIYAGARASNGTPITNGFPAAGAEAGSPVPYLGWDGWIIGSEQLPAMGSGFATQTLSSLVAEPFADLNSFDFAAHPEQLRAALAEDMNAGSNLSAFLERGGKLILWHGWADAAIPPGMTLDYYQRMRRESGPAAEESVAFYMVPGMQHCFGGNGPSMFGQSMSLNYSPATGESMLTALYEWVEQDEKPGPFAGKVATMALLSGQARPEDVKTALLCPWPETARLTAGADPDKAESYSCHTGEQK